MLNHETSPHLIVQESSPLLQFLFEEINNKNRYR